MSLLELWADDGCLPNLIRNSKDGSIMVLIPSGEFEMGDGKDTDCPKHRVQADAFYIGVTCVTNRQYTVFVEATGHRAPNEAYSGATVWSSGSALFSRSRCPKEKLDHPVVCVSWDDAMAYAKWAGCSLPTAAQWEKAARGPRGLIYPWGNEWDKNKCRNDAKNIYGQTCAVWKYPKGASGYGTLNQSGNVWEWCRDGGGNYKTDGVQRNPESPATGKTHVLRGGSWGEEDASNFRGAYHWGFFSDVRTAGSGFRLVRNFVDL